MILLSPSKTLDFSEPEFPVHSQPRLLKKSEFLVGVLRNKTEEELKKLTKISDELAVINRIEKPEMLKRFDWEGYSFNEALSSEYEFTFTR